MKANHANATNLSEMSSLPDILEVNNSTTENSMIDYASMNCISSQEVTGNEHSFFVVSIVVVLLAVFVLLIVLIVIIVILKRKISHLEVDKSNSLIPIIDSQQKFENALKSYQQQIESTHNEAEEVNELYGSVPDVKRNVVTYCEI
jgi:hypothetical protein